MTIARIKQPGMSNADYLRALRTRAVEAGLCYTCRARPVRDGTKYCEACLARVRLYKRTGGREAERLRHRRRDARRWQRLKELGVCWRCKQRAIAPNRRACQPCLDREAARGKLVYRRKWAARALLSFGRQWRRARGEP